MARHDAKRTGATGGSSNLASPVPYWKTYLGGRLEHLEMIASDVDADKEVEFVYVSGGRVAAKHANDELVWQSTALDVSRLVGIDDLNGDGSADIVVASADHVYVISGSTGLVEWAEPDGEMGTIDAVRIADLNGDKVPDLVVEECVCCAVTSGIPGVVYSFTKGFGGATPLWKFPTAGCGAGRSLTVADLDGNGSNELVISDNASFLALQGGTGAVLANSGTLGSWVGTSGCRPVDVDGDSGNEVLCILNSSNPPATSQRRVFLLHYDAGQATFTSRWSHPIAPDAGGDAFFVDPVVDLDGDGHYEVVVAGKDASNKWTTYVLDAATGAENARIDDRRLVGTAPVLVGEHSVIIVRQGDELTAYSYGSTPQPVVALAWKMTGRVLQTEPDWARVRTCSTPDRLVSLDLNQDGTNDLVSFVPLQSKIEVTAGGSGDAIASIVLPASVDPASMWTPNLSAAGLKQLVVSRTDGFLTIYDGKLQPTNPSGVERPGLRVGGFYAAGGWRDLQRSAISATFKGQTGDRIVVSNSSGALLNLDARTASLVTPPIKVWEKAQTYAPVAVPGLDNGAMGLAVLAYQEPVSDPPVYLIRALAADGSILWSRPTESQPLNDLVPGNFDGDGIPDIAFQWGDPGDVLLRTKAISGRNGNTLWNSTPFDPLAGRQPAGISVGDWNGDGRDDVVFEGGGTKVLDGSNGSGLLSGGSNEAYFLATLFDVDGDGIDEVTLHGGYAPARTYSHDLTTALWMGTDDDRPYPYGAVESCAGGPVLAEAALAHPGRLKMTRLSGPSVGMARTTVLAGGKTYSDEATARAKGERLWQLTSVAIHANLTGAGHPSAVLGSSDGWLYAVNPCNGELDFSYPFPAAVGSPIFADTDGDGHDELLVPVADGYLYGMKNEALKSPSYVWDVDPARDIVNRDIEDIATNDTLSGVWGGVAGATSYTVAIVDANDQIISSPPWQTAGSALAMTVSGLSLKDGQTYRFVVRASGPAGNSVDAISDGVRVHLDARDAGIDASDAGIDASDAGIDASDAGTDASDGGPLDAGDDARDGTLADASLTQSGSDGGGGYASGSGCSCIVTRGGRAPGAALFAGTVALGWVVRRRGRSMISRTRKNRFCYRSPT